MYKLLLSKLLSLKAFFIFFRGLIAYITMLWSIRGHEKKDRSVADIFRQWVNRHPNKVCFIFEDQEWTFQQVKYIFVYKRR